MHRSHRDRRSAPARALVNPSAMPTNTSSKRSEEAERSEGPKDTCYQVPYALSLFTPCIASGAVRRRTDASLARANAPYGVDPYGSLFLRSVRTGPCVWPCQSCFSRTRQRTDGICPYALAFGRAKRPYGGSFFCAASVRFCASGLVTGCFVRTLRRVGVRSARRVLASGFVDPAGAVCSDWATRG